MVRAIKEEYYDGSVKYFEYAGLSTDTKPISGVATGSVFMEVNTGNVYFFDEDGDSGSEWVLQFSFQG